MSALFAVATGYFARLRTFELNWGAPAACLASAPLFSLLYFTETFQAIYFIDRAAALAGASPELWAGSFC